MGCRVIVGVEQGSDLVLACFFDSVTGVVFGPVFQGFHTMDPEEEVAAFLAWLADDTSDHYVTDPRKCTTGELDTLHGRWMNELDPEAAP